MGKRTDFNLDPYWVVGFTEGEGAFMITVRLWDGKRWRPRFGLQISPYFEIVQNDKNVLEKIRKFFGVGKVGKNPAPPWKAYRYYVSNIREILVIRNFFKKHRLHTKKSETFEIWSHIIDLMLQGEHYRKNGLLYILKLRDKLNQKHPPNYVDYEKAKQVIEEHLAKYPANPNYQRKVIWKDLRLHKVVRTAT
jgi:hypothetical protein